VEITHRNLRNFLEGMQQLLMPEASDRFLATTNLIFDISGLELYLPLTAGATMVMASSDAVRNPAALPHLIRHSQATHIQATPSVWRILLASSETRLDDVHVLVGGEPLSAELAARLKGAAARVTQFYGPTETTVWSTAIELEGIGADPPPIGRPILNTQVYVLGGDRQPVPTGAVGELYIGGAGVAKGYLHRPKLTEERFLADPFSGGRMYRTGDLVRWSDDGLLYFIGRVDDQVKVNGHRVELGEIESLMLQHDTVAAAAVAAHRDNSGTVSLAAYLVPTSQELIDINSLRTFLAGRLPNSILPSSFTVLDSLPLTPSGKLDRKALPAPERASRHIHAAPVTATERKLAALWQQVLRITRVGLHDNFFEMGGDSLHAAEMAAIFPEWFQIQLPLGNLFEAPTIAALAPLIDRLGSEHVDPLSVVLPLRRADEVTQQPLFCIHPIIGISMGFSNLVRFLDPGIPVYGLQSRGLQAGVNLPDSIEEIAADYLGQIRRIQPEGPYRLIGRSLGGLIAHSIAEQMQSRGWELELLAMIDTYIFTPADAARSCTESEEVAAALRFLDIQLTAEDMPRTLRELNEFLLRGARAHSIPQVQAAIKLAREIGKSDPEFLNRLCGVIFNNLRVARRYIPRKVDCDLLYFHATQMTGDLGGILDRRPSAWTPFVRGIEVRQLACHHEAVLDPMPAAQIASRLQQWLALPLTELEETSTTAA
jgi:enterobactin synthetase component F